MGAVTTRVQCQTYRHNIVLVSFMQGETVVKVYIFYHSRGDKLELLVYELARGSIIVGFS